MDPGARLHVVGSVRLGVAGPSTDLDLVWATAVPGALDRLAALRDAAPVTRPARRLAGTVVPVVRATVGGIGVDVQRVARRPGRPGPGPGPLDDADLRAVLAVRDADALPAADPAFRALLGEVRALVRGRGSSTARPGGWSAGSAGRSWSRRPARTTSPTWPGSCGTAPAHPRRPRRGERHAYWPVYSPTPPGVNTTRSMTRSTAAVLQEALDGRGGSRSHEHRVLLTGDVEGRVLGLILALEDAGARVRPYPRAAALGVDGGDPGLLRARRRVGPARAARPPGVAPGVAARIGHPDWTPGAAAPGVGAGRSEQAAQGRGDAPCPRGRASPRGSPPASCSARVRLPRQRPARRRRRGPRPGSRHARSAAPHRHAARGHSAAVRAAMTAAAGPVAAWRWPVPAHRWTRSVSPAAAAALRSGLVRWWTWG